VGVLEVEPMVDGLVPSEGTWSKASHGAKGHKSPVWQREKHQLDGIRIPLLSGVIKRGNGKSQIYS
jgi:hypothetical protein